MLKVSFIRYKNILIAEVLDMPEKYRSVHSETKTIATRGNYTIKSADYPEVRGQIFYVRGTIKSQDKRVSAYQYLSEDKAIEARLMFEAMIEELNVNEGR